MQEKYKEIFRLLSYCKQNNRECKNQNHLTHNKLWFVTEVLLAPLRKGLKGFARLCRFQSEAGKERGEKGLKGTNALSY